MTDYLIQEEFYTRREARLLFKNSFTIPFRYKTIGDCEILLGIISNLVKVYKTRIILVLSLDVRDRFKGRSLNGVHFIFVENPLLYRETIQIGFRLQRFETGKIGLLYKEDAPWKFDNINHSGCGLDMRKTRIGIPIDSNVENNNLGSLHSASAIEKFIKYGLSFRKTIILMPFARALSRYGGNDKNSAWMESMRNFTKMLKELGFDVYVNMHGNKDWAETAIEIFSKEDLFTEYLSIQELSIFAGLCGGVVSLRSGACDLLRYAHCDLHILYPNERELGLLKLESLSNSKDIALIKERVINFRVSCDIKSSLKNVAEDLKDSLG